MNRSIIRKPVSVLLSLLLLLSLCAGLNFSASAKAGCIHDFDSSWWDEGVVVNPTCTEQGYTIYTCQLCGATKKNNYTDAIGHAWSNPVVTAPTATEEGYTTYTCRACGATQKDDYTSPTAANGKIGDHVYYFWSGNTVTIRGTGATYNYYYYKEPYSPFAENNSIQSVVVCSGVTTIGNSMFYYCKGLTSVDLGDTLTSIGGSAFQDAPIGQLEIPRSLQSIGTYAFENVSRVVFHSYNCTINRTSFYYIEGAHDAKTVFDGCEGCSAQSYAQSNGFTFNVIGHNPTDGGTVTSEPTCVKKGSRAYTCSVCGNNYQVDIPALNHEWETGWTYDANSHWHKCIRCDEKHDTTAHTATLVSETAPTCGAAGSKSYYCSVCNATWEVSVSATGRHTWNDGVVISAPTCTRMGETRYTCTVCGAQKTENPPALGHTWGDAVVTAPTCTEAGYTTRTCTVCGASEQFDEVEATGHTEVIDEAVAPTCIGTGFTEGKHCSVCGEVLVAQEVIPANGHSWGDEVFIAPTCTQAGITYHVCTVCDTLLMTQEPVPANGHTEVIDAAVAPTCTETGLTEGKHCSVCGEVLVAQEVVPANGHTEVIDAAVAPTCTETGLTEGKHCSVCGEVLVAQEVVPANGHTEVIDEAVAPTCTETGLTAGKHCAVCGDVLVAQEVVPANGHAYVNHDAQAPTCTEVGWDAYQTCENCDYTTYVEIPATGVHTPGEAVETVVTAATCTAAGEKKITVKCTVCGEALSEETQAIPALGHSYVPSSITAPSCTTQGSTVCTCERCGLQTVGDYVPALGHTDDDGNGTCDRCGAAMPSKEETQKGNNVFDFLIQFFRMLFDFFKGLIK